MIPEPATMLTDCELETDPKTDGAPPEKSPASLTVAVTLAEKAELLWLWLEATKLPHLDVPLSSWVPTTPVPVQVTLTVTGPVNPVPQPPPPLAGSTPVSGM